MSGIDEILEKGRKLNLERCHVPPKPVNRPIKSCKPRTAEEKPMQINKLQFPERFMHPECHHEADFTLNRSLLTSNDHIRVLSQPRKNFYPPHPRCVTKTIPNCTLRLNDLAQPKLVQVVETFDQRLPNLNISEIERFLNKIFRSGYQTPKEALFFIKKSIKDRKMRIRCQNAELRKLNNNLMRKRSELAVNYSSYFVKCFRPYIIGDQFISLTGDGAKYSESILKQICRLMKQNVPERDSCEIVDQIFCRIADKIASWMLTFIEKSGFMEIDRHETETSSCIEDSYPIEDFYNPEPGEAIDSESTTDEDSEDDKENDNQVVDLQSNVSDLFLRQSQVVVDPNDCATLFAKITKYQNEKIRREDAEREFESVNGVSSFSDADKNKKEREKKKKAKKGAKGKEGKGKDGKGKDGKKKGKKDDKKGKDGKKGKKDDKGGKDKKKGDKGKKGGRDHSDSDSDEFDCYGDIKKMPQWHVEWVDHDSKL